MKSTKLVGAALGLVLAVGMTACGSSEKKSDATASQAAGPGSLVGVTMPTKKSERWIADGKNVSDELTKLGYKVDLQYAEDDIPTQVNQIENQITNGAKILIIASIDGTALTTQLQEAKDKGIKVIAYDRLIRKSPNVDYYASFDNAKVGEQQATSLLTGLGLKKEDGTDDDSKGPFNIELFAGSPDDNNATFFFDGSMKVLQPYIDSKKIVVQSGDTKFETVATQQWDGEKAQKRMEDLITRKYSGIKVDGVLSPYDGISRGILAALKSNGYGSASQPYPIVTGQDAEVLSVKSIVADEQYSTIYKDTRKLADVAVKMADAVLKGATPETNNTTDYNNGVKVVPAYLLDSVIVTKANYKAELIDTGYYTAAQVS